MKYELDISDFDKTLYKQAIDLITCFATFEYDNSSHEIKESDNAEDVRKELVDRKQIIPSWLSFSAGYELLFKAVLAKHEALNICKAKVSPRVKKIPNGSKLDPIRKVYDFVLVCHVKADKNAFLQAELRKHKIDYLHDFSTMSLGGSLGNLKKLLDNKIIDNDERNFLENASQTLLDIRRNIDTHTFNSLIVSGSINGDLSNVYLPATNLLLEIYYR